MIVIVNYRMGNVGSVLNMLLKIGAEVVVSSDGGVIKKADKLVLPGVGSFDEGMRHLQEMQLVDLLTEQVQHRKIPILGICLGLQLFTRGSEEGSSKGLGWLAGDTRRFMLEEPLRSPHMGWNTVRVTREESLLKGLEHENRFYFAHSYYVACDDVQEVAGKTHYGKEFDSVIHQRNIAGTQFHPEKSHRFGMKLLTNFAQSE